MDYLTIAEHVLAAIGGLALVNGGVKKLSRNKKPQNINYIGRIYLRGPILSYSISSSLPGNKRHITPENVKKHLDSALEAKVKGLMVMIDSPGGAVVPSEKIASYIKDIQVPTVAVVDSVAASGGYWIASACDQIVANRFSMIGSIGVIMSHLNIQELSEKYGVKHNVIKSGKFKDMGNMFRNLTDEEKDILQKQINLVYESFVKEVAENRRLGVEELRKIANGLVYHGDFALKQGLVDLIGGEDEAINIIEEMGKFKHDRVVDYKDREEGLLGKLLKITSISPYDSGRAIAQGLMDELAEYKIKLE